MTDEQRDILMKGECPNGHWYEFFPWAQYTPAKLIELLDAGNLTLHCYICDTDFSPAEEAILNLKKRLSDAGVSP
jgi:hypothetical protein